MKRKINKADFENFIKNHFSSKLDFSKELKISNAHLHSLLRGKVSLGEKVYRRLDEFCQSKNMLAEDLLEPLPIQMNGEQVKEIIISEGEELIASISSRNIVCKEGFEVVCVPYEN